MQGHKRLELVTSAVIKRSVYKILLAWMYLYLKLHAEFAAAGSLLAFDYKRGKFWTSACCYVLSADVNKWAFGISVVSLWRKSN